MRKTLALPAVMLLLAACSDGTGGGGRGGPGGGATTTSTTTTSTTTTTTSDATTSTATGQGGAGGEGGGPDLDKDPADVTDPEECFYEGGGGAEGYSCDAVTVTFSRTIEVQDLSFTLTTSEGDTFTEADTGGEDELGPYPQLLGELTQSFGEPPTAGAVEGIALRDWASGNHDAPTWLEIEVHEAGEVVGAARYEDDQLSYVCTAYTMDNWCWESLPVELTLDP